MGGIGLLVTMLIRANRQEQTLSAFGLTEHYQQIFELTRLNEANKDLQQRVRGLGRGERSCLGYQAWVLADNSVEDNMSEERADQSESRDSAHWAAPSFQIGGC